MHKKQHKIQSERITANWPFQIPKKNKKMVHQQWSCAKGDISVKLPLNVPSIYSKFLWTLDASHLPCRANSPAKRSLTVVIMAI